VLSEKTVNLDLDTYGQFLTYLRVKHTIFQTKTSGTHANHCIYNTREWV